jgi:hypothetical protein
LGLVACADKLHLELVDRNLLLIVIPHKDFEIALKPCLIRNDLSNAANFNVNIFIYDTFVSLNQGINVE